MSRFTKVQGKATFENEYMKVPTNAHIYIDKVYLAIPSIKWLISVTMINDAEYYGCLSLTKLGDS